MKLADVVAEPAFKTRLAPSTLYVYRCVLPRLERAGIVDVEDATVERVRSFVASRLDTVTPQTAAQEFIKLAAMLTYLERSDRFDSDLLRRLRRLKPEVRLPEMLHAPFLTREQVNDLCDAAGRGAIREFTIRVAVLSGLRNGELCRLAWSDVDLERRHLLVRWTAKGIKTRRERRVPIVAELLALLQEHPIARLHRVCGEGLVLTPRAKIVPCSLAQRVEIARREPDAPFATLQLLRHTRASWWIQSGVPLVKVAAWMGHDPDVCARSYIGLVQGWDADADRGSA